jgi:hypothetical protein
MANRCPDPLGDTRRPSRDVQRQSGRARSTGRPILDRVPVQQWYLKALVAVLLAILALTGCVPAAQPAPAVIRTTPPPWDAPRDAVSTIAAAGLTAEPLNSTGGGNPHIVVMSIEVDGWQVAIPPYVGLDRLRAQQSAVHTHDTSNRVWLEGRDTESITLGQFFTVWAVRFDDRCLGAACGEVVVTADGNRVIEPTTLRLAQVNSVTISARS